MAKSLNEKTRNIYEPRGETTLELLASLKQKGYILD